MLHLAQAQELEASAAAKPCAAVASQHLQLRAASQRWRYMLHADGDGDEPGVCEQPEHSDRA